MSESEPFGDATYGLVMPFLVCQSQGGPFEDRSFVAGYQLADLNAMLEDRGPIKLQRPLYPELVPQLDLVAMQHGYRMEHEPWDEAPDQWTVVTFTRIGERVRA